MLCIPLHSLIINAVKVATVKNPFWWRATLAAATATPVPQVVAAACPYPLVVVSLLVNPAATILLPHIMNCLML